MFINFSIYKETEHSLSLEFIMVIMDKTCLVKSSILHYSVVANTLTTSLILIISCYIYVQTCIVITICILTLYILWAHIHSLQIDIRRQNLNVIDSGILSLQMENSWERSWNCNLKFYRKYLRTPTIRVAKAHEKAHEKD